MKLIDILLSELPARGGWPDSKTEVMAVQDADKEIKFIFIGYPLGFERNNPQIWGSNTPNAWLDIDRIKTNYLSSDYQRAIITREQYDAAMLANPILDRSSICDFIYGAIRKAERKDNPSDEAEAVYDAIAAGKIPGVKLEDLVVSVAPKKIHDHVCTPCFAGYGDCAGECHVYDLNREFDAAAAVMQEYFPNGGRDMDNVESLVKAICLGKVPGVNFRRGAKVDPYQGLDEAAKPLMKWIAENCNPHSTVIVDGGSAVLYSAENSVITDEFIKD